MAKSKAAKKKLAKQPKSRAWNTMSKLADRASGSASKKATEAGWTFVTGKKPPKDLENPTTKVGEAAAWAVLRPAAKELARVFAQRGAARYYQQSTGELPPPMRPPVELPPKGRKAKKQN